MGEIYALLLSCEALVIAWHLCESGNILPKVVFARRTLRKPLATYLFLYDSNKLDETENLMMKKCSLYIQQTLPIILIYPMASFQCWFILPCRGQIKIIFPCFPPGTNLFLAVLRLNNKVIFNLTKHKTWVSIWHESEAIG